MLSTQWDSNPQSLDHEALMMRLNHCHLFIVLKSGYPVGKDGQDELPGLEGPQDLLDDLQVWRHRDVALERDVRKLRLRRDVDGHVLALEAGVSLSTYLDNQRTISR